MTTPTSTLFKLEKLFNELPKSFKKLTPYIKGGFIGEDTGDPVNYTNILFQLKKSSVSYKEYVIEFLNQTNLITHKKIYTFFACTFSLEPGKKEVFVLLQFAGCNNTIRNPLSKFTFAEAYKTLHQKDMLKFFHFIFYEVPDTEVIGLDSSFYDNNVENN